VIHHKINEHHTSLEATDYWTPLNNNNDKNEEDEEKREIRSVQTHCFLEPACAGQHSYRVPLVSIVKKNICF
jgi:hypothetical protein